MSSSIADHLLFLSHSTFYDDFSILMCENKNFLLEMIDTLLIMKDNHLWIPLNMSTTKPIWQALVIRYLLEFCL